MIRIIFVLIVGIILLGIVLIATKSMDNGTSKEPKDTFIEVDSEETI